MKLVPQIVAVALVSLTGLTGTAFAAAVSPPGNGGPITAPVILPPSVQETLLPASGATSSFDMLGQKFGVENGRLDFFSMHPKEGGDFKPLLRGGFGEGGLKLQLKW